MSPRGRPAVDAVDETDGRVRAEWGSVTRERIVEAAIAAIREGRYNAMTIRSLATDIGVAPMTLYRHIRDRDDLLGEVADQLLSTCWRPSRSFDRWQDWMIEAADRFRQLLVEQPAVLHVYLSHPVTTPTALARMDAMVKVFLDAGYGRTAAERTYATIHTYTIGFAALEASRSKWQPTNRANDEMMQKLADFTTANQFVDGLEILLLGVTQLN